jgi:hypothetical protein
MTLNTVIVELKNLAESEKSDMYKIFEQYYSEVSFPAFDKDLCEKDYVLLVKSNDGAIRGFTTIKIIFFQLNGEAGCALFSGDTIIHHEYWGDQALLKAWCHLAGTLKAKYADRSFYWFLIVKGHRTYRYLTTFAHQFYPNRKTGTPAHIQAIIDHLAFQKFGANYKSELGLIQFKQSQGHLRCDWAAIPDKHASHPDVHFFLSRNPGYYRGDEMVCITELSDQNLRSHARRAFLNGISHATTSAGNDMREEACSC